MEEQIRILDEIIRIAECRECKYKLSCPEQGKDICVNALNEIIQKLKDK